ncbi:MAG: SRPBCC domain-containing protein [Gemmatimonadales bacterium]|jgi:uncharacterized protein YndB with AHSA1/START domain
MDARADQPAATQKEVVIVRVYDAPRRLVFAAWSRAEHLIRWWGPNGFSVPACTVDFRPGGGFDLCMRGPDGHDYWMRGAFREIVAPERIVFTSIIDEAAKQEIVTTVTFAEAGGRTTLTVRQTVPVNPMMVRGQKRGWTESLERLAARVAQA